MQIDIRVCNVCGKTIEDEHKGCHSKAGDRDSIEHFSISGYMPYGSEFDGSYIDLDICCDCMDKLIKQCAVSPIRD